MRIGTANIRNYDPRSPTGDMRPNQVYNDALTIGRNCSIWGGQEIQPDEDTPVVMNALGSKWRATHAYTEVPIFVRSDIWEVKSQRYIHFPWRADMRKVNKSSGVTSIVVQNRVSLEEFAVVNAHLMVAGYNGVKNPFRADVWDKEWDLYCDMIQHHYSANLSTFFMADLNRRFCPKPFKHARWLTRNPLSIDRIGILAHPNSVDIRIHKSNGSIKLNSDHDFKYVRGMLHAIER